MLDQRYFRLFIASLAGQLNFSWQKARVLKLARYSRLMYPVCARALCNLICVIRSRVRHATKNVEISFLRRTTYARGTQAIQRQKKRKIIHRSYIRRHVTRITRAFFTLERRTGSNFAECWKVSENYVNSRDGNWVDATVEKLGLKSDYIEEWQNHERRMSESLNDNTR